MLIPCPYCGSRPFTEFVYNGDATVRRPAEDAAEAAWMDYVYLRDNPRGSHVEWWHHTAGCRQWIKVRRDTHTHAIDASVGPTGDLKPGMRELETLRTVANAANDSAQTDDASDGGA